MLTARLNEMLEMVAYGNSHGKRVSLDELEFQFPDPVAEPEGKSEPHV
jgi:hypothetical protein